MGNKRNRILRAFSATVFVVCLTLLGQAYRQSVQHRVQQEELKEMKAEGAVAYPVQGSAAIQKTAMSVMTDRTTPGTEALNPAGNASEDKVHTICSVTAQTANVEMGVGVFNTRTIMDQYAELHDENHDLVGWLSIEGMKIDYPVMQGKGDEYYLHHDFYGNDSKYGCLYVKTCADVENGTNFIIYGHNMKDGSMFGDLDLYVKESFYQEHPEISFDTLYENRTYDIVAVFRSQVYNADDDVFKYYQFYEAQTQEEFEDFYDNIKALSLYDTGVDAQFGDTFLTLSTCAYHVDDGRLVVVARRRRE